MGTKPGLLSAYRLFHQGSLALAEVEQAGVRIDVTRLDHTIEKVGVKIEGLEDKLKEDQVWSVWKRRYGAKASLGSRQQLAKVLFEDMGCTSKGTTRGGKQSRTDEDALRELKLPFVDKYLEMEGLKKFLSTHLMGIKRELVGEYIHPSENLHLVKTYRSSMDKPNGQNVPRRHGDHAKLIRSCFIPRDGHVLVEHDFGSHEWIIAACFWRDKAMLVYASDPTKDIHRDMACECFLLEPDEVASTARFVAKSFFVFATLYGSYYANTARSLWNAIKTMGLKTKAGVPLDEHLRGKGVQHDDFENHIHRVEDRLNKRFPEWSKRKEQWWQRYTREGSFRMMTGFRSSGIFSRNDLFNHPIQGPAFHLLLWSLIQMVGWCRDRRSKVVLQIHDSLIGDVYRDELDEYLAETRRVMTVDVRKALPWVIVPLKVEAAVGEKNWYEKKELKDE